MGREFVHFRFGHFRRMPDMVIENVSFDPLTIGLFGSAAVMTGAQGFTELIEEFRLSWGR
jgi:hypothetical protein